MRITNELIQVHNERYLQSHQQKLCTIKREIASAESIINKLAEFSIAIPSWALGTGGTRFGRFAGYGEPDTLERKIEDVALVNSINRASGSISLHIPWDKPTDYNSLRSLADELNIKFDTVNSNTFQDQINQTHSYKFGSLQNTNKDIRKQAIKHNIEVIEYGIKLGSKAITVWLSDGSSFPGQLNFRNAFENTLEGLQEIYEALPSDWKIYIEYKAFEPNFYSMTVGDWGQSLLYSSKLGNKAFTLVDLGHHLPNANIEQIVSLLLMENKLAGFHFNDSKYGDDDLTVGSINPYQLFLIFNELVEGMNKKNMNHSTDLSWMIDASHNIKDPLEDLIQSTEAILISYAQALLVDQAELVSAQQENDVVKAQDILQHAFRSDVRTLVAEARLKQGGALDPILFFRENNLRSELIQERGRQTKSTGL